MTPLYAAMEPLQSGELWGMYNICLRLLRTTDATFSFLNAANRKLHGVTHWKMLRLCDWSTLESQTDVFTKIRTAAKVAPFGTNVHLRLVGIENVSFASNLKSEDVSMVSHHLNDRIHGYMTNFYRPMLEACAGCNAEDTYFVPQEHALDPQPLLDDFEECARIVFPDYSRWCEIARSDDGRYGSDEKNLLEEFLPLLAWKVLHYNYIFMPFFEKCINNALIGGQTKHRSPQYHPLVQHMQNLVIPGYITIEAYNDAWKESVKKGLPYPGTEKMLNDSGKGRGQALQIMNKELVPMLMTEIKSVIKDGFRSADQIALASYDRIAKIVGAEPALANTSTLPRTQNAALEGTNAPIDPPSRNRMQASGASLGTNLPTYPQPRSWLHAPQRPIGASMGTNYQGRATTYNNAFLATPFDPTTPFFNAMNYGTAATNGPGAFSPVNYNVPPNTEFVPNTLATARTTNNGHNNQRPNSHIYAPTDVVPAGTNTGNCTALGQGTDINTRRTPQTENTNNNDTLAAPATRINARDLVSISGNHIFNINIFLIFILTLMCWYEK